MSLATPTDTAPFVALSSGAVEAPWRVNGDSPQGPMAAAEPPGRSWPRRVVGAVGSGLEWLFGAASLTLGLAFLAAIPVLQILSLGYLIECSGRVAATGRITQGFVGVRQGARLGGLVLGVWLWLLPLRYLSSLRTSAILIHPEAATRRGWNLALGSVTLLVLVHIVGAVWRGGRLRHFLWPFVNPVRVWRQIRQGGMYRQARDAVWQFVGDLRLEHYASLGLKGFLGGLAWLGPPITLFALGRKIPPLGFVGALLLIWVVTYLPFLQAQLGVEQRLRAMFRLSTVREQFRRAPVAYFVAILITLAFALPLYLLKIEIIPREATWLPSLVFVVFIFPARLLVGWAASRGTRAVKRRWLLVRWPSAWLCLTAAAAYVLVVYFSQFTSWNGIWSLYEQHAFLVPVPFLGN